MNIKQNNKIVFFIICFLFGILIAITLSIFDHGKYYLDGMQIVDTEPIGIVLVDSYTSSSTYLHPFIVMLENILGSSLLLNGGLFNFYFVTLFFYFITMFMFFYISMKFPIKTTKLSMGLYLLIVINYSVFMATISKEFVFLVLLFPIFAFYKFLHFRMFIFAFFIITFIYSLGGRYYMLIYLLLTTLFYYFKNNTAILFFIMLILTTAGFFIHQHMIELIMMAKPEGIKDFTSTWIVDYFNKTTYIGFLSNTAFNFIRIMFPIELLFLGVKYILSTIFLVSLSLISMLQIKKYVGNKLLNDKEKLYFLSALSLVCFSFAQAIFEPDFGSVLRHKMMLLFFIIVMLSEISKKDSTFYGKLN